MQSINYKAKIPVEVEPKRLQKRIGSTTFHVVIHFDQTKEKKSLEDKFLRLIKREVGDIA